MIRKITTDLYVGSVEDARKSGDEYESIISLATPPDKYETETYLIKDGEHDYETFESAVNSTIDKLESNTSVLVHCQAGMSRSVSVCIAAYVSVSDVEYNKAFEECRHGFQYPASQLLDSAQRYINEN